MDHRRPAHGVRCARAWRTRRCIPGSRRLICVFARGLWSTRRISVWMGTSYADSVRQHCDFGCSIPHLSCSDRQANHFAAKSGGRLLHPLPDSRQPFWSADRKACTESVHSREGWRIGIHDGAVIVFWTCSSRGDKFLASLEREIPSSILWNRADRSSLGLRRVARRFLHGQRVQTPATRSPARALFCNTHYRWHISRCKRGILLCLDSWADRA